MKLKMKLVLMSVCVSALMCAAITISAVQSVEKTLAPTFAAATVEPSLHADINVNSDTNMQMSLIAIEATRAYNVERIYVMLAIVAAGGIFTYFTASHILKPLENLTQQVREISPDNLSKPINMPSKSDEVGKLGEAFSQMTKKLSSAYEMQKSFSAAAAHELRTPLSVITAEIDVFNMEKDHTQKESEELVSGLSQSVTRLESIVEDLLCFTNQNSVDMNETISLRELIEEISTELSSVAARKNVKISVNGEAKVNGEDRLLQRVFYNIIENAIKYNNENGEILINLFEKTAQISDTGIGISADDAQHIFEPFYRADKSRSRAEGGSGLGLAIVKQIVEKHHGEITVQKNEPHGTVFSITFL